MASTPSAASPTITASEALCSTPQRARRNGSWSSTTSTLQMGIRCGTDARPVGRSGDRRSSPDDQSSRFGILLRTPEADLDSDSATTPGVLTDKSDVDDQHCDRKTLCQLRDVTKISGWKRLAELAGRQGVSRWTFRGFS